MVEASLIRHRGELWVVPRVTALDAMKNDYLLDLDRLLDCWPILLVLVVVAFLLWATVSDEEERKNRSSNWNEEDYDGDE